MFKWARNKALADPIPVPSDVEGADGLGSWEVFTHFGREVFAVAHAEDQDVFENTLAEFRRNPQRVRRTRELEPAVGTGVALVSAVPYLLPVVSMLLGVVGERVSNRAIDLIESTTRRKIARLLENHRRDPADPTDAEGEPERLGADEERQLHAVLLGWGVGMRMEADAAGQLADSVIEALRRRGSEDR
ncbi:hypothetical protein G3I60_22280 [Streptomyces sp. SID13666]|uniref:hypothetical protein n=1 Tax=unclassified Streptomyces TaxID=2593676 RepID=UPI0013C1727D|nr:MULTISPECIES: hypothetical protein [unclassified Streptomyces]NEA56791.1 hypothetical protein [Streptomyces sp. SID13666]NEA72615.1 hypothetical protein [Streptomyces sp. SID13588]